VVGEDAGAGSLPLSSEQPTNAAAQAINPIKPVATRFIDLSFRSCVASMATTAT
jgi:hypothetical protein